MRSRRSTSLADVPCDALLARGAVNDVVLQEFAVALGVLVVKGFLVEAPAAAHVVALVGAANCGVASPATRPEGANLGVRLAVVWRMLDEDELCGLNVLGGAPEGKDGDEPAFLFLR